MTKNIYQIKEDYLSILDEISAAEGELMPELEVRLTINEQELKEKSINYAYYIKKLEADNNIIKAEIDRLKDLKDSNSTKIERLEKNISDAMLLYKVDKIETPILKLSFRKNEAVNILDESKLSDNFFTTKITKTVSKTAIKDALKSGVVDGAEIVVNYNLQIK